MERIGLISGMECGLLRMQKVFRNDQMKHISCLLVSSDCTVLPFAVSGEWLLVFDMLPLMFILFIFHLQNWNLIMIIRSGYKVKQMRFEYHKSLFRFIKLFLNQMTSIRSLIVGELQGRIPI